MEPSTLNRQLVGSARLVWLGFLALAGLCGEAQSMPPMARDAQPAWEVATVKPSPPDEVGTGYGGPPRHFKTGAKTLNDLITFAYRINTKQVAGGPDWVKTAKFDIVASDPDQPGNPSDDQTRGMMRKLLEQRFGLQYHHEARQMSAFVLNVAKGGPKLTPCKPVPDGGITFYFAPKLGNLHYGNVSLDTWGAWMENSVFDRPLVNHTGIAGCWDGTLNFAVDETQFIAWRIKVVLDESPDAPPPIYTAIQQQMGLKLDAEKTAVDVLVLDHVERPTEN